MNNCKHTKIQSKWTPKWINCQNCYGKLTLARPWKSREAEIKTNSNSQLFCGCCLEIKICSYFIKTSEAQGGCVFKVICVFVCDLDNLWMKIDNKVSYLDTDYEMSCVISKFNIQSLPVISYLISKINSWKKKKKCRKCTIGKKVSNKPFLNLAEDIDTFIFKI